MAQQLDLAGLFRSVAQELSADRGYINSLDGRNGNTGDNMANNFRLVSEVLAQGHGSDREGLMQAAAVLRQQGQGGTAPLYASGLEQAAQQIPSGGSFSLDDLLPLLNGLLGGVQQASGAKQGEGTMLDALIPGVLGYMQSKQRGASEIEAILDALAASRRGTYSGGGGQGGQPQQPQQPRVDPGAAGVGSLLEGLFRGLLQNKGGGLNPFGGQPAQPGPGRLFEGEGERRI